MAAKKKTATKKKPTAKKASSEVVPFVPPPVPPEDAAPGPESAEFLAKIDRWRQVWELHRAGMSFEKIAAELGGSSTTAHRHYHKYDDFRGVSPMVEAERKHQLSGLAVLEEKYWSEGVRGQSSWPVVGREIRSLYADRRDILGFDRAEPAKPSGVLGADGQPDAGVPVDMPAEVVSILDRLTG